MVHFTWKLSKFDELDKKFILFGCIEKERKKEVEYLLEFVVKNIIITNIFLNQHLKWNRIIRQKVEVV